MRGTDKKTRKETLIDNQKEIKRISIDREKRHVKKDEYCRTACLCIFNNCLWLFKRFLIEIKLLLLMTDFESNILYLASILLQKGHSIFQQQERSLYY